jgi:acyl-CoA synthetase (AMP-forming)/AMP-acid ligase II
MLRASPDSLWQRLCTAPFPGGPLRGATADIAPRGLAQLSSLGGHLEELRGRSVLIRTRDQLVAGLALIELDGVARRVVVCPPGVAPQHLPAIITLAEIEAVICDEPGADRENLGAVAMIPGSTSLVPLDNERRGGCATEWILLTSGTTGRPKLVIHSLASLAGATTGGTPPLAGSVWSTFYDIRRYGGLQIFLRALLGGTALVLSSPEETAGEFLTRAARYGVTHMSGTPSHWRRALMGPAARRIAPGYVRLSGEIADQGILDALKATYPQARVAHAFASTEAGVAFEVGDGLAGFPADLIGRGGAVEMKVEQGSLRIRSARIAAGYLGGPPLIAADGFVDTGDLVERRGERYYFVGRSDGVINVGGLKVHPEEVEAVINRHPSVRMSRVKARRNPITGAVLVADIVLRRDEDDDGEAVAADALKGEIIESCSRVLPPYKVPAAIRLVTALEVTAAGKLVRQDA